MTRNEIEDWLKLTIPQLHNGLASEQVVASAALFQELGFDSLAFEKLVAAIESSVSSRDLTPWFIRAVHHGEDTVGSLIDFLADAAPTDA